MRDTGVVYRDFGFDTCQNNMADTAQPDPPSNGKSLMSLLSGNKLIMALIVISGGGNLWQTHVAEQTATGDVDRAISEIHMVYGAIGEALDRSKRVEAKLDDLLKRNNPPSK
jgi:hypothetical protein